VFIVCDLQQASATLKTTQDDEKEVGERNEVGNENRNDDNKNIDANILFY